MHTVQSEPGVGVEALRRIEQRVLWLAVRMIDYANRERPPDEVKVGGHQASSASMVSIMTSLWFGHLRGADKVAVKPHASPVYHAIKYLTGELDRSYLTRLREFGGLQAYPSRTKDPDVADFSTGSVGLGVVAPLFAAAVRRYVEAHFGPDEPARFIALAGDAELDEGNVWEAVTEPALQGLGNVLWIVDTNRQSLDRVVPGQKIKKLKEFFAGAGWHVVEAKYGQKLQEAFEREGGEALRQHIEDMRNELYQSLFPLPASELRDRFLTGADSAVRRLIAGYDDRDLPGLVLDLGGHDLEVLGDCYRECDRIEDQPSVVIAYTIKGWGLPLAGDPLNHSALLTPGQIDELRRRAGLSPGDEWDRFEPGSPEAELCEEVGGRLKNREPASAPRLELPEETASYPSAATSTQETFGRVLARLGRVPGVAEYLVTVSPDVAVSTGLGGWINRSGVFSPEAQPQRLGGGRALKWEEKPSGRHIPLGISEMNLFMMLGALGLGLDLHDHHLLPIGTLYDPFVCRGLDALIYALYNGARFIVAGTPSGITLAPEGGAHQSSITPSIGLELPGITYAEPAYAQATDWLVCDGLKRLGDPSGSSLYLRLSTRPLDQTPFLEATERIGTDVLRRQVLDGGYRLREPGVGPAELVLAACGAVIPEVLEAAEMLESEGLGTLVLDLTSPDHLYRSWRRTVRDAARVARPAPPTHTLARLLAPSERRSPIVTVHDAASHHLAWLGSVFGARTIPVGVDEFGQSGRVSDLYRSFDLLAPQIVNAALVATG